MKYFIITFLIFSSQLKASVSVEDYNLIVEDFISFIVPMGKEYDPDYTRSVKLDEDDLRFGAYVGQLKEPIVVRMGLLTSEPMTIDSVLLTLCHEIGHNRKFARHFIGKLSYAFGHLEQDYFATKACLLPLMASSQYFANKNLSESELSEIPESYQSRCETDFSTDEEVHLCLRGVYASMRISDALFIHFLEERQSAAINFPPPSLERERLGRKDLLQSRLMTFASGIFGDPPPFRGSIFLRKKL